MHRRLQYLILAITLLIATVSAAILVSAAIRYNRNAGLYDIVEPDSAK
jgi:hypothetical protein